MEKIESQKKIALQPIPGQQHTITLTAQFNEQLSAFETTIDHDDGICGQELLVCAATFLNHVSMVYAQALGPTFAQQGLHDVAKAALTNAHTLQQIASVLGVMAGSDDRHVDLSELKDKLV